MSLEIKIHSKLLELPASSLSTASKSSFWEHLILAKGLVVLRFLESAVFNVERLILLPCITLINAMQRQITEILHCPFLSCFLHIHESPRSVLSQVKEQKVQ